MSLKQDNETKASIIGTSHSPLWLDSTFISSIQIGINTLIRTAWGRHTCPKGRIKTLTKGEAEILETRKYWSPRIAVFRYLSQVGFSKSWVSVVQ